jgi:hypothetical protein
MTCYFAGKVDDGEGVCAVVEEVEKVKRIIVF